MGFDARRQRCAPRAPLPRRPLKELDDKLVELSPTRWRSGEGSGYVLVGMERPSELSPREISPRPGTLSVSQVYATPTLPSAFGMDLNQDSGEASLDGSSGGTVG
eukprot:g15619.t1